MESLVFGLPPQFLWGFAGSMAVEIIKLHESWDGTDHVPTKYKKLKFWFVRFLVACVGGGLAYAYGIEANPLLAANVGASAPVIMHTLKNGERVPVEPN